MAQPPPPLPHLHKINYIIQTFPLHCSHMTTHTKTKLELKTYFWLSSKQNSSPLIKAWVLFLFSSYIISNFLIYRSTHTTHFSLRHLLVSWWLSTTQKSGDHSLSTILGLVLDYSDIVYWIWELDHAETSLIYLLSCSWAFQILFNDLDTS